MRISDWSSDVCSSVLLVERRDAHEAGKPEPQDAALGDEGVGLARSDAGLLRLLAGIHLDVALRCDAQLVALPGHGAGELRPVDGLDHVEDFQRVAHLVGLQRRSEEHTSELQSLMRISYAVFCLKKKTQKY